MTRRMVVGLLVACMVALLSAASVAGAPAWPGIGVEESVPPAPPLTPAPPDGTRFPQSFVTSATPNCGLTRISGQLTTANGQPIQGLAVRVAASDGSFSQLTPLSDANGRWSMTLANGARSGLWFVWVDYFGQRISDSVNVLTNGPDRCAPGSGGVQVVDLLFRQAPNPQPLPPNPPPVRPPLPVDSTLRFPYASITRVASNCTATNISGVVVDSRGNPVNGVPVKMRAQDGTMREFRTVSNGNFGFFVGPQAVAGLWGVWVEEGGKRESTIVDILTNGPDRCQPGSGGIQTVEIRFQRR